MPRLLPNSGRLEGDIDPHKVFLSMTGLILKKGVCSLY